MSSKFYPKPGMSRAYMKDLAGAQLAKNPGPYRRAALFSLLFLGTIPFQYLGGRIMLLAQPVDPTPYDKILYEALNFAVNQALAFVLALLLGPLSLGVTRYFISAVKAGAPSPPSDVFFFYRNHTRQAVGFYARLQLRYIAIALIPTGVSILSKLLALSPVASFSPVLPLLAIVIIVLAVAAPIVQMYLQLTYFFSCALFVEDPDRPPAELFRLSRKTAYARRWRMFVFQLSFLGWAILSAATLLIAGVIYVIPYYNLTFSHFYLSVKKELNIT